MSAFTMRRLKKIALLLGVRGRFTVPLHRDLESFSRNLT